jgi:hypothetical protein
MARFCFGAFNFEVRLAMRDFDIQVGLDAPEVFL